MKTTLINLYGGPGSGKSTLAAAIFHALKVNGGSVELVTEFVKDWAYQGREVNWYDQVHIFSQQLARESVLYGKVKYIVTDSPTSLSAFYENKANFPKLVESLQEELTKKKLELGVSTVNILLPAPETYQQAGRYQTHEEALDLHEELFNWLNSHCSLGGNGIYLMQSRGLKPVLDLLAEKEKQNA